MAVVAVLATIAPATGAQRVIELRRRPIEAPAAVARAAGPSRFSRRLQLVQFESTPSDADLTALLATGVRLVAPVPHDAYLVWTDDEAQAEALTPGRQRAVRMRTSFEPLDALAPALDQRRDDASPVDVTVQLVAGTVRSADDLERVIALADVVLVPAHEAVGGKYLNVRIRLPGYALDDVTALETVVNVEPWVRPTLLGERQGQILAASLDPAGSAPSAPGYLSFLAAAGFSMDPADYPIVAVVDDGVDNGTTAPVAADLYRLGSKSNPARMAFAVLPPGSAAPNASGPDGHGTINASIIGGYNAGSGAAVEDAAGFNHGLGISPYGRLANVRIFAPDFDIGFGNPAMIADYHARGARISANSWGADVYGSYDSQSQEYDALTRDARAGLAGNQGMLFVFAAGNEGPNSGSIGSPGSAKNVITVGASETSNPAAVIGSGCGDDGSDGNDARDMSSFSSRGPCDDGRMKPDIVAPGTFIQGLAAQPTFTGSGVCGPSGNNFAPPGTDALHPPGTAYTWSSGTSHSTPAIAGAASLTHEFLGRVYEIDQPSPALTKAYLLHGTRHLTGNLANETLPGRHQGYGIADLGQIFDASTSRLLHDQTAVLGTPGQTFELTGEVSDPARPVRIVLAWTDAPGSPFASAYVNDLDLAVEIGGVLYRGNNFLGSVSQSGGVRDTRNNVEAVYLPPGTTGLLRVVVEAVSLPGDGVPGNADSTDQDFALVVGNVTDFTPRGTIFLNKSLYNCAANVVVSVADSDLAATGFARVTASSTSADVEDVDLVETASATGLLVGTVTTATGGAAADGVLQVADGDVLTVTYHDADDGSGSPATVADTALVDCVAPIASDIGAIALNGGAANVSLTTNEPTTAVVRYGTSCAALSESRSGNAAATSHTIGLDGLTPETLHYYVVEITDAAGNVTRADTGGNCFTLTTPEATRYFVEQFTGDFDLGFSSVDLMPDGSTGYYSVCRSGTQSFPTDPAGGTVLDLDDDEFAEFVLADGREVSIYGQTANSIFVSSNGFVGLVGDSDYSETIPEHFAIPRVSALYDDLNPSAGGTISVKQLADRVAITFENVPEYLATGANSFQIELHFDGRITLNYLAVSALDGIAGVSAGSGLPADFAETDLGSSETCSRSAGTIAIDAAYCGCSEPVGIEVRDLDLVAEGSLTIDVATTRGDSETLELTEAPPGSGRFSGVATTAAAAVVTGDGTLQLGGGDTVLATYHDADDGTGVARAVTSTATALCLDPFVLYKTTRGQDGPRFRGFAPADITDAFRTAAFKILKTEHLGSPGGLDSFAATDATTHLLAYRVREDRGEESFARRSDVRVRNRCGTVFLDVQRPASVLLPASLGLGVPASAITGNDHELDTYLCYKVKTQQRLANGDPVDGLRDDVQVTVVDALNGGTPRRYDLKAPTRLCRPAALDGSPVFTAGPDQDQPKAMTPATVRHPAQDLLCYGVALARRYILQDGCGPAIPGDSGVAIDPRQQRHTRIDGLHTADGFGTAVSKSSKEKELCLPAVVD